MRIVGIDPGLSGALALIDEQYRFIACEDIPTMARGKTKKRKVNVPELARIIREWEPSLGVLELVTGAIGKPGRICPHCGMRKNVGAASGFNFGHTAGAIEATIAALGFPYVLMSPQVWKRKAGLLGTDKEASRAKAIELWPGAPLSRKKDHARAEALLIARFGCVDHINHPIPGDANAVDQLTRSEARLGL